MMLLDEESWNTLRRKAIKHFLDERKGQQKEAFFNQLNEAFAYRYLLRRGYEKVRFIKEGKYEKRPDICFFERGMESYCEVKTIGISDNEITRRETRGVQDGSVYFNLSTRIENRLEADIRRAWTQIHSLGERGLVFVLIRFDDIAQDHYRKHRKQLAEFCRRRKFERLVIKIGHWGNRGIRRFAVGAKKIVLPPGERI